jgi:hypothetical protein
LGIVLAYLTISGPLALDYYQSRKSSGVNGVEAHKLRIVHVGKVAILT